MKHIQQFALLAATLAAALAMPPTRAAAFAGDDVAAGTDPSFTPGTGQINRGYDESVPSIAHARQIPTPAQARAALKMPDSDQPALGGTPPQPMPNAESTSPKHDGARRESENASGPETVDADQSHNTGSASSASGFASGAAAPSGPIGATGQTMPAKFSQRNDVLDRVPIMAWPRSLSDEERQHIYQAVMADKMPAANDAARLAPASQLDVNQALHEMHALPASLSGIGEVRNLSYVKSKTKVFLVKPATRIVVDEIGS
jgi:hypothetical protein